MTKGQDDSFNEPNFLTASYKALADDLPINLLLKDTSGKILFANQAYLAFSGRDLKNIVGKSDYEFVSARLGEKYRRADQSVIKSGQTLPGYGKHESANGVEFLMEYRRVPVFDDEGNVVAIEFMCWDVTRRRKAEDALAQEQFLFNSVLENSPDAIYFKDKESRFTRVSKSLTDALEKPVQEIIGKTDADFFLAEHAKQTREDELRILKSGKPMISQLEKMAINGKGEKYFSTTKIPLRDSDENIVGIFGISRDVTELNASQQRLRNALLLADGASRAKSEFVANMSHEIRTPMNGIIGIAELLSETTLDVDQREYVDMIRQSSDSLMGLLNDILDFSKIEAGKLKLDAIPFNLSDSVGKTTQTLASRAAAKGLELAYRVSPGIPERLIGDPSRLRQVIVNLVGNAIKFTEEGEIVVEVVPQSINDDIAILNFSVRDTGIGIPEEKRNLIFEEFSQADSSTTRRYGGTGLGLTISKQLVELMNGKIWVEGELGVGTTFHFSGSFKVAEEQPATSKFELASLQGVPTLVVDDNATNRRIVEEMLKGWGLEPKCVDGGVAAITEMQAASKTDKPYRLILLDCMMPGMDGFSVAELVTGNPVFRNPTIIMISSATGLGDAARCRSAGITHHMTKPVIKSELFDVIVDALGQHQAIAAKRETRDQATTIPLSVLLVEDDLINQRVAKGFLEQAGHSVAIASNGLQAIAMLEVQNNVSKVSFDVVLMDIQMPEIDGFKTTVMIREQEKKTGAHIPIIAMTAAAMKGDRERCLNAGMDAYITKPVDPKTLFETIASQTSHIQPRALDSADSLSGVDIRKGHTIDNSQTKIGKIDFERSKANLPNGGRILGNLLSVFQLECPRLISELKIALNENDFVTAKRAAHTLHGSARILQANELAAVARHVELLATDEDLAAINKILPRLTDFVSQTCGQMREHLENQ